MKLGSLLLGVLLVLPALGGEVRYYPPGGAEDVLNEPTTVGDPAKNDSLFIKSGRIVCQDSAGRIFYPGSDGYKVCERHARHPKSPVKKPLLEQPR